MGDHLFAREIDLYRIITITVVDKEGFKRYERNISINDIRNVSDESKSSLDFFRENPKRFG